MSYIEEEKKTAKLITGGGTRQINGKGLFIESTLFVNATNNLKIAREEIFGPVLPIIPFDGEEEAMEEDFPDNAVWSYNLLSRDKHVMPWRIEDALRKIGANYVQAGLWRSYAVRDGNLITGQQNFSGAEIAQLIIEHWDVENLQQAWNMPSLSLPSELPTKILLAVDRSR